MVYPKSEHYYCGYVKMTCSTINRTTSTPFPSLLPLLVSLQPLAPTCTKHASMTSRLSARSAGDRYRNVPQHCRSMPQWTSPIILPLTNHAHQQVDVVGSFLRALSMLVVKGVGLKSDEMMKWDLTLHSFCTSKTGETMQNCLVMWGPETKH